MLVMATTLVLAPSTPPAEACTNFLVSKGASADQSTMITYAADSHDLYGELYYWPAGTHPPGTKRTLIEWDTGKNIGTIPEAPVTYRVVGNMNEHQVAIGETTFGGRKELEDSKQGIDYGSLIYLALQRARTAREAIQVMTSLANEHGYRSVGETFSLSDPNEVWIMDLIGKGKGDKGVVWVACRVPEGHVTAHANAPRILRFPRTGEGACLYAKDVVDFARKKGWYKGTDEDFSFRDAYAPFDCQERRVCDGRVWSFYRRVAPSLNIPIDWVKCKAGAPPLPLFVKPDKKLTPKDLMAAMRDHFEGTEMDLSKGVGAGPFSLPYRWRPMTIVMNGKTYLNERSTATQQTGFSFVTQSRATLPGAIGGLLWFSVDDMASTVYVPMYMGITQVPKAYAVGTADFKKFSWDSAFWTFTFVSNWAYTRWSDISKDIQKEQSSFESGFLEAQAQVEAEALKLHQTSPAAALAFLNRYSTEAAARVVTRWRKLGEELLVKYMDGNVRNDKGEVTHPPYPEHWQRRMVAEYPADLILPGPDGGVAAPKPTGGATAVAAAMTAPMDVPMAPAPGEGRTDRPPGAQGCGCRTTAAGDGPAALLVLLLVGLALRRRR
jgi:MYXO-CTERM domain-containing protein